MYSPSNTSYIKHIDGLRALAVLMVIMLHLDCLFFSGGFIGVDVFFVISSYLITNILVLEINKTGKINFINFYFRRAKRILPALLFMLLCVFAAGALLFSAGHFKHLGGEMFSSALSFSNFFFWYESKYFDLATAQFKPLLNTWSLGVEEQFYLIWPLLIFLFATIAKKGLPVLIVFFFLLNLGFSIIFQDNHVGNLYYLTPFFRVFEFCIGALMVWLIHIKCSRNYILEIICGIGIALIFYSAITYDTETLFPSYNALLPCFGAAMIIYAGTAKYLGQLFSNWLSRGVGLISYSLYLVHWPIIVFYSYYLSVSLSNLSIIDKLIIFTCSFILATLMYYFIEQPFRKLSPKTPIKSIKQILLYFLITIIIAAIGASVYFSENWLWKGIIH